MKTKTIEKLLHYVWKHKLYQSVELETTDGSSLEIIDPGILNTDAGPDFFNAKIKLGDKLWVGNVEIHLKSSDWYNHNHHQDEAYNSVILHVVESVNNREVKDSSGRIIPQWSMNIPQSIKEDYVLWMNSESNIPCLNRINELPEIYVNDWLSALLLERLERKNTQIQNWLEEYNNSWDEVFYIVLSRNFGFGINNDAFERLAKSLPLKYILKHSDSQLQTEALFLGQAGLLDADDIEDSYYQSLRDEYQFLSKKYDLSPLPSFLFKSLKIRPNNFPHVKIVQLAGLVRKQLRIFSCLLKETELKSFRLLFDTEIHAFWETHYHFKKAASFRPKKLGLSAIDILIINVVVPVLFAYGKKNRQEECITKAIGLLESLKPENNFIVNLFKRRQINIQHAGDSQAFIQLKREYCDQKKCIFCRIGHKLLSKLV
ncbi:MAG: DUF2851 family protein [Dysgonamonadaceae bacterium]|jgi:hypothetical protein|nr:DUF2851 family protein [Dysgonamonadaceae bacterium]